MQKFKFENMKENVKKLGSIFLFVSLLAFVFMSFSFIQSAPWVTPDKYKSMKNPTVANAENNAVGKALYAKHCKSCHGNFGKGDGPKAASMKTKMPDLTSKSYKGLPAGEKYYRSFIGRDEMPNFETKIPEVNDRWYVVNYMETLK